MRPLTAIQPDADLMVHGGCTIGRLAGAAVQRYMKPGGVGQGLRPDKLQTLRPHRLKWEIPTLTGQNVCLIHASRQRSSAGSVLPIL